MGKIEIELNLNSITDTLKNLAEGVKEQRSAKLIDIEGKGISVTIACNKEEHFLKDWDKTMFVDTATFTMVLIGPTAKQTSIEEFENKDEEKPKAKRGRPAKGTKGTVKKLDELNELLNE